MRQISADEVKLIKTVRAHLRLLTGLSVYNVDEATLRAGSASLRALLVEQMLIQAWKASGIGGPITLRAQCIDSINGPDAVAFCGGGDLLPGIPFAASFNATVVEKLLPLQ